ncbi:membrane protein insertion efficiency factor YidD [Vibrio viridaestus]|uniref:Membrane protein insertion efficiency factor YidD n=1 Tax=Vibrio viridaestus TaxID=2487322 RepID=A0A3N9TE77_9VIBR|nr:membrane protein insertion efficiency factor YidD [Vibrio viridaestus]RQW61825.1 membrane protein insertion efficiency factor YidD [Vibrio viridaestus]
MLKILSLRLIEKYQSKGGSKKLLSIECNFEPSCSEYTRLCIEKYGFYRGWKLGLQRIRKCNQPDMIEKIVDDIP